MQDFGLTGISAPGFVLLVEALWGFGVPRVRAQSLCVV